jgi:hypothetical protein
VKLPNSPNEGSLPREIVIQVLREHDVEVTSLGADLYKLFDGNELEVQAFQKRVVRAIIQRLKDRYQIPITNFYYSTLDGTPREKKH